MSTIPAPTADDLALDLQDMLDRAESANGMMGMEPPQMALDLPPALRRAIAAEAIPEQIIAVLHGLEATDARQSDAGSASKALSEARELYAERERYREEVNALEAERDRLRQTLTDIQEMAADPVQDFSRQIEAIARAALAGGKESP